MNTRMLATSWLFTVVALPAGTQAQACPRIETGDLTGPIAAVRYLADDALRGRLAGSAGERCAGEYIANRMRRAGLAPAGQNGTYFQDVPLGSVAKPKAPAGTGRNVIGVLHGTDPRLRQEYIVVGAHYDHLGYGDFGSLSPEGRRIHNGADDNASGVAVLLETAERLSQQRPARSVLFVAFSGEESGLLGSMHFVEQPPVPLGQLKGMLNLDMVGRLRQGGLIVYGIGTATEWEGIVTRASTAAGVKPGLESDGYGASDHTSFYLKDIPVLHFFTNTHDEYHRPEDDWQLIDGDGLERVATIFTAVTREVASAERALTLVRGAGRPPAASGQRGYGASLGTVPDMRPVERGVRLQGIRAGSAAEAAGLKAGDIIIQIDDEDIADLMGMTEALRKRKPGQSVRIGVLRNGSPVTVTAVLR